MAKAANVQTPDDLQKADFMSKAMLASSAAWAPNPRNPPRFFDLAVIDGKSRPDIVAKWAANAPLAMIDQYIPNLRTLEAVAFDAGDHDLMNIADTVRTLDSVLSAYGIAHVSEIYPGDNQREQTKQHVGVIAADTKAASNERHSAPAVEADDATPSRGRKYLGGLGRRPLDATTKAEGRPLGSTKQSPASNRTGSPLPSTTSQQPPDTIA